MSQVWLQIQVEESLLKEATQILDDLGLDMETAVNMFLKRSVMENGLPFKTKPSKEPYKAEKGYRAMLELQDAAQKNGTANMTLEEINAEIEAVRREQAELNS